MTWLTEWIMGGQASTTAAGIDNLFMFISVVNLFFFALICFLIVVFVTRYRRRGPNEITPHITHNQTLEIVWSVVPLIILIGIFFWGFHGYVTAQIAPANSIEIQARAKKWVWEFEYPDGMRTLNSFHVPVNRPVRMVMNSEDVIHSFFVPAFRVKKDVLPNRYTELWFHPTKAGVYQIFCTEYCGKGHSDMLARVFVDTPEQYEYWLREGDEEIRKLPLKDLGQLVHENRGCATCHSLDGSRGQGPSWKGIFGSTRQFADGSSAVADENYIRQSVLEPQAHVVRGFEPIMPTYKGLLRDREILGVIEFLKTLK
jgi:cytochrome c oxidase subunit 2